MGKIAVTIDEREYAVPYEVEAEVQRLRSAVSLAIKVIRSNCSHDDGGYFDWDVAEALRALGDRTAK